MARSESTQDGKLVHKKKRLAKVQEKIVELTARKRLCLFKSDRENDILSEALGNAEHTGHIRGVTPQRRGRERGSHWGSGRLGSGV
jgi:hypothetical protein